ncbi:MAG: Gmad2 immunoglobulin-like domain-containing protein [Candidatus Paceibacterota bacterium]
MVKKALLGLSVIAGFLVIAFVFDIPPDYVESRISSFEDCVVHGYEIRKTTPRVCVTSKGREFSELPGTFLRANDAIQVTEPQANAIVSSPITVLGLLNGDSFSDGVFAVRVISNDGEVLGEGIAQAHGDWSTSTKIAFRSEVEYRSSSTVSGLLQLYSPTGLFMEVSIPVVFSQANAEIVPQDELATTTEEVEVSIETEPEDTRELQEEGQ